MGRTFEKGLSQVHPLVLAPAELAANKQFFTGRKLKDLEPLTGFGPVDQLWHYTPASRQVGDVRSLLDPRKGWLAKAANLFTGVKVGTYNLKKLKLIDMRAAEERELAETPEVGEGTYYYPRAAIKGTPEGKLVQKKLRRIRALSKAIKITSEQERARKEAKKLATR